ncbi:hypothetical protein [Aeromonas sobria]|uniref:hypothetical protein n=1 Tax=Aeromonas sobria TaxID=646 RepID=UPI0026EE4FD9|nr:hypothetical protein [Aeromonas sobria]
MKLTAYQRRQVDYVKANVRGMVQRRRPEMTRAELRIANEESDVKAMTWLDSTVPRWREGKPPKTNKIYVAALSVSDADEEQDDERD